MHQSLVVVDRATCSRRGRRRVSREEKITNVPGNVMRLKVVVLLLLAFVHFKPSIWPLRAVAF